MSNPKHWEPRKPTDHLMQVPPSTIIFMKPIPPEQWREEVIDLPDGSKYHGYFVYGGALWQELIDNSRPTPK